MTEQEQIKKTEDYIRSLLEGEGSGHDWWHIHRVRNNAMNIAKKYDVDHFLIEMLALLHDIADHKFHDGDESIGLRKAQDWLLSINVSQNTTKNILETMSQISFSKGQTPTSLEGQIVQDADRLDAIGAIGIARTFAYGGYKRREIYNPEIPPAKEQTLEEYKKNTDPTINHFYDKLLRLKDMMNTSEAKEMAGKRQRYMEDFLLEFYAEWDGEL